MIRFARLVLLAYPRSFRREFGDEWLRTVDDLRTHDGRSGLAVVGRVMADTCLTAPRLRWESSMPTLKSTFVVLGVVLLLFGLVLGAGVIVFPVAVVLAVLFAASTSHDRPVAAEAVAWGRHWYAWMIGAAACFLLGGSMLFTSADGELSSIAWPVWILSWLAAATLAVIGLGLGITRFVYQRRT